MPKRHRRVRRREEPVRWFVKQNRRWLRRAAIIGGLTAVAVALWFVVDPLQGPPKAIDASGREVTAGVLDTPGASHRAGSLAPNFVLPDYDRKAVYRDQFDGNVVFINFWASWCTFCDEEMPDIMRIARDFPDEVVVLAVNRGESKGTANGWTSSRGFEEMPNVHWLLDDREDVARAYRVDGMPQSFVIDDDGILRDEIRRVTDYDEIRGSLEQVLNRQPSAWGP